MKMLMTRKALLGMLGAAALAAPSLAFADDPSIKGMITSHTGQTIVVRTGAGDTPVLLTDTTKIRGTTGVLGIRGDDHPATDLIPGLAIEATTTGSGATLTATDITFKNSDLKTAQQIAAGLATTDTNVAKNAQGISQNAKGVAENSQRIDEVGELVSAGRTKIFFAVNSSTISAQGKQDLMGIAAQAAALKTAYRLAVVGRADPTGNAAANQRLSEARAAAVKAYLMHDCGVSPANFIPVASLGSAPVAQDPDPPGTPAEARRVTVTIAVSKSSIKPSS
jgi:outer membrane protein OmpA-like peptidoglycan-associated protein